MKLALFALLMVFVGIAGSVDPSDIVKSHKAGGPPAKLDLCWTDREAAYLIDDANAPLLKWTPMAPFDLGHYQTESIRVNQSLQDALTPAVVDFINTVQPIPTSVRSEVTNLTPINVTNLTGVGALDMEYL